jgi:hypothetical protein
LAIAEEVSAVPASSFQSFPAVNVAAVNSVVNTEHVLLEQVDVNTLRLAIPKDSLSLFSLKAPLIDKLIEDPLWGTKILTGTIFSDQPAIPQR